jgi:hypothetical protein
VKAAVGCTEQECLAPIPGRLITDPNQRSLVRQRLKHIAIPSFSHPDWIFETKWDGLRALLLSDLDGVRLASRNGNTFKSFPNRARILSASTERRVACAPRQVSPLATDMKKANVGTRLLATHCSPFESGQTRESGPSQSLESAFPL